MLNPETIEFIRWLHSDFETWKEVTEIQRTEFINQHELEKGLELLEEQLDYYATVDESNPFNAEILALIDMEAVVTLIAYGHLVENGECLSLKEILYPFKKILEGKRINGQTTVGYEDPHAEEFFDISKESCPDGITPEEEFDQACEASKELRSMNHGSVFDLIFK